MTDSEFDKIVELEERANALEVGLMQLQEGFDQHTAMKSKLSAGFRQAKGNLAELRLAPVVNLAEWNNVSQMAKTFVSQLAKAESSMAEMFTKMAEARVLLSKVRADLAAKYLADEQVPDNVLEFPSALRRG